MQPPAMNARKSTVRPGQISPRILHLPGRPHRLLPLRSRFSSPRGLTLMEMLVALAFIAVVSGGIASLAIGIVRANAQARMMDMAIYLAHDRLEVIRNAPYAGITAANFPAEGYGSIAVGTPSVSFPDFQRSVAVQDNTPFSGVKRVVVTVSWRNGSLTEETIRGQ